MVMALDEESLNREKKRYQQALGTQWHQLAYSNPEPLVSVIIPTYNRPDLLRTRSLKSVLGQTYRNLQVLVIGDGCPNEETAEAVASFQDPRVRFVNLEGRPDYLSKGGWYCLAIRPMNHGLTLAEGDFITGLDDDDEYHPDRIRILVEVAQKQRADLVFHTFKFELSPGHWVLGGGKDGKLGFAVVNNSTTFYHRFFKDLPYDWECWNSHREPADWNRFRKMGEFNPRYVHVSAPLLTHYLEGTAGFGSTIGLPKLHLYCGGRRLRNWVNIDPRVEAKADLVADPAQGLAVADGGAEDIFCSLPPRLDRAQVADLLKECARALKPGGSLVLPAALFDAVGCEALSALAAFGFVGIRPVAPKNPPRGLNPDAQALLAYQPCWQAMMGSRKERLAAVA